MGDAKLTAAQLEVLLMLSVTDCDISRSTHHACVSGATVSALEKRGLARRRGSWAGWRASITDAGRAALAAER